METLNTGFTVDIFTYLRQYPLHLIKCELLTVVILCAIDPATALVAGAGEDFQGMNPNQMAENLKKWKKYAVTLLFTAAFSQTNRRFFHDVTAAILLSQSNGTEAMLMSQTRPAGIEPSALM